MGIGKRVNGNTHNSEKKKFACKNAKMSTPALKKRSQSMIGKRVNGNTHNSEKKRDRKKAMIVPSSNDHKFNSGTDSKLNRKVLRKATPFKKNMSAKNKKKASKLPVFGSISESAETDSVEEEKKERSEIKKVIIAKKQLAFDPNKVTSRLFQSTSSSNNKMRKVNNDKKIKKRAETPQVRSSLNKIRKTVKKQNWTNVKSKIDTGRKAPRDNDNSEKLKSRNCGVKRRLEWLKDDKDKDKNTRSVSQPPTKKRRMSAQTKPTGNLVKRWN